MLATASLSALAIEGRFGTETTGYHQPRVRSTLNTVRNCPNSRNVPAGSVVTNNETVKKSKENPNRNVQG